jgi:hypothetical protein
MEGGESVLFLTYAIDSTLPALLKSNAVRSIGSDVNTSSGIISSFLRCTLFEVKNG